MAFTYTSDQQKVIDTRGSSILVSAAAGSGKTAVLVQRIIQMITDKEKMISIDQLLIVTFTKAAASEMRERIGSGIENAIEKEEDDEVLAHLISQLTLLSAANIMTMHSFCLKVIKSYYHLIGLDPTFRIGNETELVLMKEEVMDDLLEECYEEARPSFLKLIESFASGKNDDKIKEIVFRTYGFAMSNPWPDKWLDDSLTMLDIKDIESFETSVYYQIITESVVNELATCQTMFETINDLMRMDQGPDKYKDTVDALRDWYDGTLDLIREKKFSGLLELDNRVSIPALSRKTKGYDKELAAEAKDLINAIKKTMESTKGLRYDRERIIDQIGTILSLVGEIVELTKVFSQRFQEEKEMKAIIDFNDIEHFALKLLYTNGQPSEISAIYRDQFAEILVDEYQDTNDVQEAILQSLSRNDNLFMVGDLKQSIYKFRLAKPEIFKEKYERFVYEDSEEIKIDLAKNFRSRSQVLDMTNHIFEALMSKDLGDVDYDEHAKLYLGSMDYDESPVDASLMVPEVCITNKRDGMSKEEVQSEMVCKKIQTILSDEAYRIFDKETKTYRQPKYDDICILMRSPSSTIQTLKKVMEKMDVPYQADISTGFFDAVEVSVMVSLLKIIDNPFQDIPLASVLRSPVVDLSEKDLLTIKEYNEDMTFQESFWSFAEDQSAIDDAILEPIVVKIRAFLNLYNQLRDLSLRVSLDQLIDRIFLDTGYYYFVGLMENGDQRMNNLDYLKVQAKSFESSSYKGLFNFIRYIEHIKKYEIEIPEPMTSSRDQGVSIMSVHKSKGLEFPIVILMNVHKAFNEMDLREGLILHQDLGFGCDYFNDKKRLRMESAFSKALKLKSKSELLSEELRLFYVALTRAREKLILTGVADVDKVMEQVEQQRHMDKQVPVHLVAKSKSFLDWLLLSCPDEVDWVKWVVYDEELQEEALSHLELEIDEVKRSKVDMLNQSLTMERDLSHLQVLNDDYHHAEQVGKYVTMSVSELKEAEQREKFKAEEYVTETDIEAGEKLKDTLVLEKPVPEFVMKKNKSLKGAVYGLVMHKILSLLPPKNDHTFDSIKTFVDELFAKEILEKEFEGKIYIKPLLEFTRQPLYQDIVDADEKGKLHVEQPFVLGIDDHGDIRMVQGVIDLYYETEKGLVLLDYKTDYIEEKDEDLLLERYRTQLGYYQRALEDITGKPVIKRFIYSLSLGKLLSYE